METENDRSMTDSCLLTHRSPGHNHPASSYVMTCSTADRAVASCVGHPRLSSPRVWGSLLGDDGREGHAQQPGPGLDLIAGASTFDDRAGQARISARTGHLHPFPD